MSPGGAAMHVMVHEPFEGGHHSHYVRVVVDALLDPVLADEVRHVTLSVSRRHANTEPLVARQTRSGRRLGIRTPDRAPDPTLPTGERTRLLRDLIAAVDEVRPDAVILTSADAFTLAAGLTRDRRARALGSSIPIAAISHYGLGRDAPTRRARAKGMVYRAAATGSPWSANFHVNPLVALRRGTSRSRYKLIPDPVDVGPASSATEARGALGIPVDGRYIGHIGAVDTRKAIPELLAAFRARGGSDDRLLLAGELPEWLRALIMTSYRELEARQQLVLVDRMLSETELELGISAVDVVTPLHHPRAELSSNLLKALLAGRPVLVDQFGYTGYMARATGGIAVDVTNRRSVEAGVALALSPGCPETDPTTIEALRAYHHPQNFSRLLFREIGLPSARTEEAVDWPLGLP